MTIQEPNIALVTGASRGIGKAIAIALAQQGNKVIGTATTEAGAAAISAYLNEANLQGYGVILDIANKDSINSLFKDLEQKQHLPNILVNNAGITRDNLMLRMKESEWEDIITTNLSSVFYMTKLCLKPMLKVRWGRIINISSVSGCAGSSGQANYAAAKAGVIGFSKSLAKEIATRNITVNVVAPGFVKSDMTDALASDMQEKILQEIPMQRIGQPEEIAAAVTFLASSGASYITGETIHVNGGMYMV